jgi:membrane protein YqaA with SNARE-associated domain
MHGSYHCSSTLPAHQAVHTRFRAGPLLFHWIGNHSRDGGSTGGFERPPSDQALDMVQHSGPPRTIYLQLIDHCGRHLCRYPGLARIGSRTSRNYKQHCDWQRHLISALLAYGGLFLAALAAGSILPMQPEAALAGLLLTGELSTIGLILMATVSNVAGLAINWSLGRGVERFKDRTWFPVSPPMLERTKDWYSRYGRWSLLLSWFPIFGDHLTVVAGVMREPLGTFIAIE